MRGAGFLQAPGGPEGAAAKARRPTGPSAHSWGTGFGVTLYVVGAGTSFGPSCHPGWAVTCLLYTGQMARSHSCPVDGPPSRSGPSGRGAVGGRDGPPETLLISRTRSCVCLSPGHMPQGWGPPGAGLGIGLATRGIASASLPPSHPPPTSASLPVPLPPQALPDISCSPRSGQAGSGAGCELTSSGSKVQLCAGRRAAAVASPLSASLPGPPHSPVPGRLVRPSAIGSWVLQAQLSSPEPLGWVQEVLRKWQPGGELAPCSSLFCPALELDRMAPHVGSPLGSVPLGKLGSSVSLSFPMCPPPSTDVQVE